LEAVAEYQHDVADGCSAAANEPHPAERLIVEKARERDLRALLVKRDLLVPTELAPQHEEHIDVGVAGSFECCFHECLPERHWARIGNGLPGVTPGCPARRPSVPRPRGG